MICLRTTSEYQLDANIHQEQVTGRLQVVPPAGGFHADLRLAPGT